MSDKQKLYKCEMAGKFERCKDCASAVPHEMCFACKNQSRKAYCYQPGRIVGCVEVEEKP